MNNVLGMQLFFVILKYSALALGIFGISFFTATRVQKFALRQGIYALSASGSRIALWGGLAFMLPYALYGPIFLDLPFGYAVIFFLAIFAFVLFGLLDDLVGFSPLPQILTQTVVALAVLFIFSSISGNNFPHVALESLFLLLFLVAAMNAMNWIDGLDGLAGETFVVALLPLAGLFIVRGDIPGAALAVLFLASVAGFLALNIAPAKLYMGTTGSMGLGLFVGVIAAAHPELLPLALCSLAVPLGDACKVSMQRVFAGNAPWQGGDRRHLHYQLSDSGLSCGSIVRLFVCATGVSSFFGIAALLYHAPFFVFLIPLGVMGMLSWAFEWTRYRAHNTELNEEKSFANE